jgi:hypothetical protein
MVSSPDGLPSPPVIPRRRMPKVYAFISMRRRQAMARSN